MYIKKINNSLNNYILSVSLLIIIIPPIHYLSSKHTEEYNKIMQSLNTQTVQNIKDEFKTHIVKAENVELETSIDGKGTETIPELIERVAKSKNFPHVDYLKRLANCESKFNPNAKNGQGNKPNTSVDRGLYQINSHWHKEVTDEVAYSPEKATEWTIDRINQGYQREWVCNDLIKANPNKYR